MATTIAIRSLTKILIGRTEVYLPNIDSVSAFFVHTDVCVSLKIVATLVHFNLYNH